MHGLVTMPLIIMEGVTPNPLSGCSITGNYLQQEAQKCYSTWRKHTGQMTHARSFGCLCFVCPVLGGRSTKLLSEEMREVIWTVEADSVSHFRYIARLLF